MPMIYIKTALGQAALHNRSMRMVPRQRSAFILCDGKRSVKDVLQSTLGLGVTADDLNDLVELGLLTAASDSALEPASPSGSSRTEAAPQSVPVTPSSVLDTASAPLSTAVLNRTPSIYAQAHYSKAYPIAIKLTAGLGLRGFLLNLAVEGATDLSQLQELAPRIKKAVGPEKFRELEMALYD